MMVRMSWLFRGAALLILANLFALPIVVLADTPPKPVAQPTTPTPPTQATIAPIARPDTTPTPPATHTSPSSTPTTPSTTATTTTGTTPTPTDITTSPTGVTTDAVDAPGVSRGGESGLAVVEDSEGGRASVTVVPRSRGSGLSLPAVPVASDDQGLLAGLPRWALGLAALLVFAQLLLLVRIAYRK
jgi:hypothetical protein